jgi:putative heme-binding domain-containing protein
VQRENLKPERLLWGSPVDLHVTWHGLAWGPEGDLYFSSGDPLLNYGDFQQRPDHFGHWTIYGPNEQTAYTGVGGFYRCKPDGSGLKVVAGGTRGAVGVAFDRRWNLFSNDNDHESIADRYSPARLLHVAPQANFFWPRGWIAEMSSERSDLLGMVNTNMGREVPVGQAYLDEPSLGERYTDSILVARWGQRRVSGYQLKPRGASFSGEEYPLLIGEETARPVGVTVGSGGRVFVAISYMAGNEWSPKYPSEIVLLTKANETAGEKFQPYDAPTVEPARLWSELSSDSSQRRQQAQVELFRRGGALLVEAAKRLKHCQNHDPAFIPLVWLSAASGTPAARAAILGLVHSDNADVRAAAIRALHEFPQLKPESAVFMQAIADTDAAVRHAALVAYFDRDEPLPLGQLSAVATSSDTYLRQAAALLLARRGTAQQIQGLLNSSDAAQRLAGVLAAGFRLTVPPAIGSLPKDLPLKYESGNAEFVIQYADAKVDLKSLGRVGSFTTAERWKHLPHSEEETQLFQALLERLGDSDDRVFQQAAYFLNLFDVPQANEAVANTRRQRLLARLAAAPSVAVTQAWAIGPFDDLKKGFATIHPPEQGPIDLSAEIKSGQQNRSWQTANLADKSALSLAPSPPAQQSSYAWFRLQSLQAQPAQIEVSAPAAFKLWHNGRAIDVVEPLILALEPGSNDILLRLAHAAGDRPLAVNVRASEQVAASLPEKISGGTLAERLRSSSGDATQIPAEFLAVDWSARSKSGDAERGRRLFGADALGCVKCHAVLPNQKGGGAPSLAGAKQRFTVAHLVESVLAPGKTVAPVFGTTTIVTADGQSLSGLVVEENNEQVVLLLPTATRQSVLKSEIEARKLQNASPMPSGLVKTPAELADLLAYLLSENPQAP